VKKSENYFHFLLTSFVAVIIVSNVISGKLIQLGPLTLAGATIFYPVTFLITDIVGEIWGKERGLKVILWGFYGNLLLLLGNIFIIWAPGADAFVHQAAFETVLGASSRIIIASMVAYMVSQYHDVWAFAFWKSKTGGKHKWVRNNLSTMTSQILDTFIFTMVAFYGLMPNEVLWSIGLTQYGVKFVFALFDTPFFYLATAHLEGIVRQEGVEVLS